jgi:trehalose 6-phosphate synthase
MQQKGVEVDDRSHSQSSRKMSIAELNKHNEYLRQKNKEAVQRRQYLKAQLEKTDQQRTHLQRLLATWQQKDQQKKHEIKNLIAEAAVIFEKEYQVHQEKAESSNTKEIGCTDRLLKLARLQTEVERLRQKDRSLIILSNRGPIEYQLTEDQKLERKSGVGGLSTALAGIETYGIPVKWFSSPMSKGDRKVMEEGLPHHFVPLSKEIYTQYYNGISNNVLWFAFHEMYHRGEQNVSALEQHWKSYTQANRAFADVVHTQMKENSKPEPVVMIQDYHLLQVAGMLRERHPTILLQHFLHIPWPKPKVWKELPEKMVKDIYSGMCGNDIIGFQTNQDAQNFLKGAQDYLPDAEINFKKSRVRWQKHDTQMRVYPISISIEKVRAMANMGSDKHNNRDFKQAIKDVLKEREGIQGSPEKRQKILRVDRIEPTKNILVGFQAYDWLLETDPQWRGKVVFRCRLVPSRAKMPIYEALREEIDDKIEKINKKYGNENWTPIDVFIGHDYPGALADMTSYDVLLVNPIKDGMNLVAKEGVVVNQNDGLLILSQEAGAFHELKNGAIPLASPGNIEETTEALKEALTMSAEKRKIRAAMMRKVVECNDLTLWLSRQFHDLNAL